MYNFAEAKILSALLLENINKLLTFDIHQAAVAKELGVIIACDGRSRKQLLRDFINQNTHTLVGHAVGYHRGTFSVQKPSSENKTCFVVPRKDGMGHGGAGSDKYVVALLDW